MSNKSMVRGLSLEELEAEQVLELPDRTVMQLVVIQAAAPVNISVSAVVLSLGSAATSTANQDVRINQVAP